MSAPSRLITEDRLPWLLSGEANMHLSTLMRETVQELAGPLAEPLLRVLDAGGKRLRPALTFGVATLTPEAAGASSERRGDSSAVLRSAAAVELLHCATLVHDDLIDNASIRRGVATINATEGAHSAIVGGDVLIAASMSLAAQSGARAVAVMARTLADLCRGEALQAQARYDARTPTQALMEIARLKTGSLLRAACLLGAEAVGAPRAICEATAEYGMNFGICLQLLDDVLDIASTSGLSGKPVGADFVSGILTIPGALALADNSAIAALFRPSLDAVSARRAVMLLQDSHRALSSTISLARRRAEAAAKELSGLRDEAGQPAQLASWPQTFVDGQLASKIGPAHRWLLDEASWLE